MNSNEKYSRQINLPQVGENGQSKLENAKILLIGAGGLGNAVLPYLTASGIGEIGVMDGDIISESNLHRQVLFQFSEIGLNKAEVVCEKMRKLNTDAIIKCYPYYLSGENALELFSEYDLVVDATDSIAARYLINDAALLSKIPFVHASIYRFQVQVSVFNYKNGPTYRCLFPVPAKNVQNCAEAGVLGTTVAYAGMLQANEVMKIILEIGEILSGKLLVANTLTNQQDIFNFRNNIVVTVNEEFFREQHCQKTIALKDVLKSECILLDVRSSEEIPIIEHSKIVQIPINILEEQSEILNKNIPIYTFCQSGKRSKTAQLILQQNNFKSVYCLKETAPEIFKIMNE